MALHGGTWKGGPTTGEIEDALFTGVVFDQVVGPVGGREDTWLASPWETPKAHPAHNVRSYQNK